MLVITRSSERRGFAHGQKKTTFRARVERHEWIYYFFSFVFLPHNITNLSTSGRVKHMKLAYGFVRSIRPVAGGPGLQYNPHQGLSFSLS